MNADLSGDGLLIWTVKKNARELLQIRLREFKGHTFVDLRLHYVDGEVVKPTAKGCTLPPAKLPELIEALQRAEAEARTMGLLS
jgi:hypothetical protein